MNVAPGNSSDFASNVGARVKKSGLVVFDRGTLNDQPRLSSRTLHVRFARPPRTADEVIIELVRQEKNPRGLTVVTSDARVRAAAQRAGASVQEATTFARAVLAGPPLPAQKEKGLSPAEVEAWEQEFKKRGA